MGYSHTSIKAKFSDSELKHTGLTPNLTLGYKYENFLASLTLEGGDLKKDSSKIKQNNMLGLVNIDYLLGVNDIFAILGLGLAKQEIKDNSGYKKDFGIGAVLRAGGGYAYKLNDDMHLFADGLFRYSLKKMEHDLGGGDKLKFSNLYSFGINVGVAF